MTRVVVWTAIPRNIDVIDALQTDPERVTPLG